MFGNSMVVAWARSFKRIQEIRAALAEKVPVAHYERRWQGEVRKEFGQLARVETEQDWWVLCAGRWAE